MTNKIFSLALLLGAALLFTDCKREEDDLFSKSAAERLNDVKDVSASVLQPTRPVGLCSTILRSTRKPIPWPSAAI